MGGHSKFESTLVDAMAEGEGVSVVRHGCVGVGAEQRIRRVWFRRWLARAWPEIRKGLDSGPHCPPRERGGR